MSLGIIELVTKVGEDHIHVQNIFEGDTDVSKTKRGTRISFYTDPANVTPGALLNNRHRVGLILWLDRADVDRVLADHAAPPTVGQAPPDATGRSPQGAAGHHAG